MSPANITKARAATLTRPVVRSATAAGKLAASLRRLGVDDRTVAKLTAQHTHRRPAR